MKIYTMEQGCQEWFEARKGIPTASEFDRILTGGGKLSKQAAGYAHQLIGEKHSLLTPEGVESFTNRAIRHGINMEAEARRWYEMDGNRDVQKVGFITTNDGRFGGSPDALVMHNGMPLAGLELKCPQAQSHVEYCLGGKLPTKYKPQVHGHLWISKLPWWDFVSYHPGPVQFRTRVMPDDYTAALGEALEEFYVMLKDLEQKYLAS